MGGINKDFGQNIHHCYTIFRNNISFPVLILFDKYEGDIFLRKIIGCVWLTNLKGKVIIVTLTEILFQIDMFTAEKLISFNVERYDRSDSS